jgi:ankyrin repeat protein
VRFSLIVIIQIALMGLGIAGSLDSAPPPTKKLKADTSSERDWSLLLLTEAVEKGDASAVQAALVKGARPDDFVDSDGGSLLHKAIKKGYVNIAQILLAWGAEVNHKDTPFNTQVPRPQIFSVLSKQQTAPLAQSAVHRKGGGQTALHYAVMSARIDAVALLLAEGADLNELNNNGESPLYLALARRSRHIASWLILHDRSRMSGDFVATIKTLPMLINAFKNTNGNLKELEYLVKQDSSCLNETDSEGRTALHWAAFLGCDALVSFLLNQKADVDAQDRLRFTPLFWAIGQNHENVIKLLLDARATVEVLGNLDYTPLHCAAYVGNPSVVQMLLEKLSYASEKDAWINAQTAQGLSPLHIACQNFRNEATRMLLLYNAFIEDSPDRHLSGIREIETLKIILGPLCFAAIAGDCNTLQALLLADYIGSPDQEIEAKDPLIYAASRGIISVVNYIMSQELDRYRNTNTMAEALRMAITNRHYEVVKSLMRDCQVFTSDGQVVLRAITSGSRPIIELLLDQGFSANHRNILTEAIDRGYLDLIPKIISQGVDVAQEDSYGRTPLRVAMDNEDWETIQFLITLGAPIEPDALHFAVYYNKPDLLQSFLDAGADPNTLVQMQTAFQAAVSQNKVDCAKIFFEHEAVDISYRIKEGDSAESTAEGSDADSTEATSRYELTFDSTLLHLAVQKKFYAMVKAFIEAGAEIDAQNINQETPLHYAVKAQSVELVQLLLNHGASTILTNSSGETAEDLAKKLEDSEIKEAFVSHASKLTTRMILARLFEQARQVLLPDQDTLRYPELAAFMMTYIIGKR